MRKFNEIIRVSGRVQGVGFRYSACHTATAYGIKGFVTNEPDGSVYIEAEGTRDQLDLFLEWCRSGPSRAIVHEVRHYPGPLVNFTSFEIR